MVIRSCPSVSFLVRRIYSYIFYIIPFLTLLQQVREKALKMMSTLAVQKMVRYSLRYSIFICSLPSARKQSKQRAVQWNIFARRQQLLPLQYLLPPPSLPVSSTRPYRFLKYLFYLFNLSLTGDVDCAFLVSPSRVQKRVLDS